MAEKCRRVKLSITDESPNQTSSKHRLRGPFGLDALCVLGLQVSPRHLQVIVDLEVHPEFCAVAEIQTQAQRGVGRNAPSVIDDLGNPVWRDAHRPGELTLRQIILRQELVLQHFAWGDWRK